jgi:hypothetical protein
MGEAEQRDLIDRYIAACNRFDLDGMLGLLADDVRFENVSGGQVTASTSGVAEFPSLPERAAALFAEREQRVTGLEFRGGVLTAAEAVGPNRLNRQFDEANSFATIKSANTFAINRGCVR